MQDYIYFFGGPRHGDRIAFSAETDERLRKEGGQYVPFTGNCSVPPGCRPWVWNQLDGAGFSELMAEP